jgi:Mg2+ and Co2+ transporter CorA
MRESWASARSSRSPQRDVFARDAERIQDLRGMEADDRFYFRDLVTNWINSDWSFWVFGIGLLVVATIGFLVYFRHRRWM